MPGTGLSSGTGAGGLGVSECTPRGDRAAQAVAEGPEHQHPAKSALDVVEPVGEPLRDLVVQEGGLRTMPSAAVPLPTDCPPVEDLGGSGHGRVIAPVGAGLNCTVFAASSDARSLANG